MTEADAAIETDSEWAHMLDLMKTQAAVINTFKEEKDILFKEIK